MLSPIIARGSLRGRPIRTFESAGFVFTETRHRPNLTIPRHANDRATVIAVLTGDYVETLGAQSIRHPPGSLILRPPSEVHSNSIGPRGAHCLLVELTAARLDSLADHRVLFDRPRTVRPGPIAAVALRATRELSHVDDATSLILESLALELIGNTLRHDRQARRHSAPAWLQQAREVLDSDDGRSTLGDLARRLGLHPVYLARAFRAHFGCSVGEYARRGRVARACDRLASDQPLSEIALESGFHDQSHFSRVFRQYTAMSPGAYRRALRQGSDDAIQVRRMLDDGERSGHP
jgi:AraC family transcriptional regulator